MYLFPRLSAHWENLNEGTGSFEGVDLLLGWLITEETEDVCNDEPGKKKMKKTYTWNARFLISSLFVLIYMY